MYNGSAAGTIITGQDGFYVPEPGSYDGLVYTYAGNALGLPANPSGGGDQFAGVTGGEADPVAFARAQRDVVYGDGTGVWTVSFDIAATYLGVLPSAQNIGSFSTQVAGEATFIALATWTDPATAANWDARYVWYNAVGTQVNEPVGGEGPPGNPGAGDPAFQGLAINHWYRQSTTFNLDNNQILQVSITDLTTGVTSTNSPLGRYLEGGAAGGAPPPSGFRLFGGSGAAGAEGNTLAFDNVSIDLRPDPPLGSCCFVDESCVVLTEADCIAADGAYSGDGTGCTAVTCVDVPPACEAKDAGPCGEPNGTPGCEDVECCVAVCDADPICCLAAWDQTCADIAIGLGCAPGPGQPVDLATGSDSSVDGYLRIGPDGFGQYAVNFAGGTGLGDNFNPVGAFGPGGPTFAQAFSIYRQAASEQELLSLHTGYPGACFDGSMNSAITGGSEPVDTNGDGVVDTRVSLFDVTSASGMDTSWELTQHVFNDTPKGGPLVAIVTFDFVITNNGPAVDFVLQRHLDMDSPYVGDALDDNVGTGTNGAKGDRFVYMGEADAPETHVTLSSPSGDVYYGGKQNINPDPDDPNCPIYAFGTDTQICDAFGTPACWHNHIAGVGYNTDGDSGTDGNGMGGADGFVGLEIPVSLAAEGVTTVSVMLTYGAQTPGGVGGGPPCPWDLDNGGFVGAGDLLLLLADWGNPYGAAELLALLADWGVCP